MLVRRAITQAMDAVKELDAAMTEIAVVTDFSIGDMWNKLPEYTKNANDLGVAVKDLYNATGLYYQQGLKGNEVMSLGVETMKMARIAGMDAADATKAMTAAIRGFNMEVNEISGQRVNDVYSQLAAMTASDTKGIADAMSKTASIAYSANMELETTAALLAQIIETTQESPETAGTAMKTIIARFTEVKDLFSEGMLTGKDEEGEEININRIDAALKTVGISLKDFLNGTKGIDDIFLELAQKWDTLDLATQRYIATTAAGSRQQSRFIAMMQDYDRTMELVSAANNSAGASQEQYEKTLESMETLLTKLKNAWQEFLTGITNSEVLKFGIKTLTEIINLANKLTGWLPGIAGSIVKIGIAWGGLKLGSAGLTKGIDALFGKFTIDKKDIKGIQSATLIQTKNGVEQGTEAGAIKGLKDIGPWIKTQWAKFVADGVALGNKKAETKTALQFRTRWLKQETSKATAKRMATSNLTPGSAEYEAERKKIQLEEWKRIKKESKAADMKLESAFVDKSNANLNTTSSKMELESAYKEAIGDEVELTAANTESSTVVVEVSSDIMENEAAKNELLASLSKRSGGKNIQLISNKDLGQTQFKVGGNVSTGTAVKQNIWSKLGVGKGGGKWSFSSMAGGAIAGGIAGGIAGNIIGGWFNNANSSLEEQAGDLKVSLEGISSTVSTITENLDGLDDAKKNFADLNKTLKEASKGSSEYTRALIENNQTFFDLNEDFNFLVNEKYYEKDAVTGAYTITDAGWAAYEQDQTRKLEEANLIKLQTQMTQASVDMSQAGINFAKSIGKGTSEITAKEEKGIRTTATATGVIAGGAAGAIATGLAAGASFGSLGGPIGIAIGAIAGLIVGGISAALGANIAKGIYGSGLSADTYNEVALRAGKAGLVGETQYSGEAYISFLEDTANDLGVAVEDLKTIIETDKEAFAEHVAAVTKSNAILLAQVEQLASAFADQMGLIGDEKRAYVETYKAVYGEEDFSEEIVQRQKEILADGVAFEKQARKQQTWNQIARDDEEKQLAYDYAKLMGYTINENDNEKWLIDAAGNAIQEIPTLAEMAWAIADRDVYEEKKAHISALDFESAQAQALGLVQGTANVGGFTLGSLQGTLDQLNSEEIKLQRLTENFVKNRFSSSSSDDIRKILIKQENLFEKDPFGNPSLSAEAYDIVRQLDSIDGIELTKSMKEIINSALANTEAKDIEGLKEVYGTDNLSFGTILNYLGINTDISESDLMGLFYSLVEQGVDKIEEIETGQYLQEESQLYKDLQAITEPFKGYLGEALENLTVDEGIALKGQFDLIGSAMTNQVQKLMSDVAASLQESDLMHFDEILALGLDPEAIYNYVDAMEQQNRITEIGANTLRRYADDLANLNLGFDSISLTTLSERISGVQKYQQKIGEVELGEKLILTQEEVDEMMRLGLASAEDFWKTSEGFEYIGGPLDELNDTALKILETLGGRIEGISEATQKRKEIWQGETGRDFRETYNEETDAYEWITWEANQTDIDNFSRSWTNWQAEDRKEYYDIMTPRLTAEQQEALKINDWSNLTEADYNSLMRAAYEVGDYATAAALEYIKNNEVDENGKLKYTKTSDYQSYSAGISSDILTSGDATLWTEEQLQYFYNTFKNTGLFTDTELNQVVSDGVLSIADVIAEEAKLLVESETYSAQQANWQKQSTIRSLSDSQLLEWVTTGKGKSLDSKEDYAEEELNRRAEGYKDWFKSLESYSEGLEDLDQQQQFLYLQYKKSKSAVEEFGKALIDNKDAIKSIDYYFNQGLSYTELSGSLQEAFGQVGQKLSSMVGFNVKDIFLQENWGSIVELLNGNLKGKELQSFIAKIFSEGMKDATKDQENRLKKFSEKLLAYDGEINAENIFEVIEGITAELGITFKSEDEEAIMALINLLFGIQTTGINIPISYTVTSTGNSVANSNDDDGKLLLYGQEKQVQPLNKKSKAIKNDSLEASEAKSLEDILNGLKTPSGGGSSSDWENPYDPSYNTLRQINAELRKRERLERTYQQLLDKEGTSYKDLVKNSQTRLNQLATEIALQGQLRTERESQIRDLMAENNEYGNYVSVNADLSDFYIDWSAIEALEGKNISETGMEFREGLENYISKLEEYFDSIYDIEKEQNELLDEQKDILDNARDKYLEAESLIKEAILSSYQEQIDELSKINNSINDANSHLLDAIQSSVEQMRQDRENERKEEELSDKERRLAYLRQDTSGGNALEILELEKELAEGREDYTDSLVDQKIEELQRQNDAAAEQRERQIDLMQDQLDYLERSGLVFDIVEKLYSDMFNEDGTINWDSEGAKLLVDQAGAMSDIRHMQWMEETENVLAEGIGYLELLAGQGANALLSQGGVGYDKNYDYMAAIQSASTPEDAAQLEQYRNFKIASEGRTEDMTYTYEDTARAGFEEMFNSFAKDDGEKYASIKDYIDNFLVAKKGYAPFNESQDYMAMMIQAVEAKNWQAAAVAELYRNYKIDSAGLDDYHKTYAFYKWLPAFKTGGMADFTGPAWLDGTKSRPEMVLNQRDTQNFIQLKDVLGSLLNHGKLGDSESNGDVYYNIDINVERISSDYDIDEVVNKIKQTIYEDASYRNVNAIHLIR